MLKTWEYSQQFCKWTEKNRCKNTTQKKQNHFQFDSYCKAASRHKANRLWVILLVDFGYLWIRWKWSFNWRERKKKMNWENMLIVHKDSVAKMKRTKTKHNLPTLFVVNNTKQWPYFERFISVGFFKKKNIYNLFCFLWALKTISFIKIWVERVISVNVKKRVSDIEFVSRQFFYWSNETGTAANQMFDVDMHAICMSMRPYDENENIQMSHSTRMPHNSLLRSQYRLYIGE